MVHRTGIVGTGFGADVHAPILLAHPCYELVALSSIRTNRAQIISNKLNIMYAFDDWKRMINEANLDLVIIAANPTLHMEITLYAINSGVNVLCEKPPALNYHQVSEMQNVASKQNRIVAMNFEWRYLPERQAIKKLLDNNEIGELFHVDWSEAWPLWPNIKDEPFSWQWELDKGGGMLGAVGSHMIDALYHWFGPFSENIQGFTKNHVNMRKHELGYKPTDGDDSFFISGEFKHGGTFNLQFIAASIARKPRIEIFGSKGTLILKGRELRIATHKNKDYSLVDLEESIDSSSFPSNIRAYVHSQWMLYNDLSATLYGQVKGNLPNLNDAAIVQDIMDRIRKLN
ncbi:Gfo/Idh/MocA family oxidoreductase [Paenibacillus motobuensis]|uniref:Gfo/Idh/MocA family protein n=1 Tax=Paenibacillus TaxID=44249 RepID=UPI00203B6E6A|nr:MULTISPECIES: Gfo/Idh/MocA family oxidoreductase [Paenibacillus]MCM3039811.1 Gfo/Idh/MocA family oxidoreductase [Paenibacillus lutimineralis]MCM3646915.1 Gfo/Idh/MocA family oxidoreductase [Paenibacillus motobuensis]